MNLQHITQIALQLFKQRKRRTLYLFGFLAIVFIAVQTFSRDYLITIPVDGGSFSEAMVGFPRFVNPVLALSQTDKDLSALIFSGLLRKDADGQYSQELAKAYTTNEDFTEHVIVIDTTATFHDGTNLTIDDVAFTYQLIRDPLIKSPLFPRLNNVEIEVVDEQTIKFILESGNEQFKQNLDVGIISRTQWQNITSEEFPFAEQNISPIGTGPYHVDSVVRSNQQKISSYILAAFRDNISKPHIQTIELKFYATQNSALNAFESGLVDNLSNISAQELLSLDRSLSSKNIQTAPLPRIFSLFFNQSENKALQDKTVRTAIKDAVASVDIARDIFFERAVNIDGPLPKNHPHYISLSQDVSVSMEQINASLEKAEWVMDEESGTRSKASTTLAFSLHVPDSSELIKSAELISESLSQVGIRAEIVAVNEREIVDSIVRRRDFEILLFGQIVDNPLQLHAFWHSNGTEDPGVNIAGYKNKTVDAILERLLDNSGDAEKQAKDYENLQKSIRADIPVVFLYSPYFIYASDQNIRNNALPYVEFATDRWNLVSSWYIETEYLLPFFTIQ